MRQLSHDPSVLEAFALWLWQNGGFGPNAVGGPRFDAVLLTGDMAATGNKADLQAAHNFINLPPRLGSWLTMAEEPTLEFGAGHIKLLPGNHDRYRKASRPGGTEFDKLFRAAPRHYWRHKQGFALVHTLKRGNAMVQIWAMDFTLRRGDPGVMHYFHPGKYGQGRVQRDILYGAKGSPAKPDATSLVQQSIDERVKAKKNKRELVTIWAMHFDPTSTDPDLQLLDSRELIEATERAGVSAILCGHTHESKVKALTSTTTVFACGSTAQANNEQNDFQVLGIDVPGAGGPATFRVTWYRYGAIRPHAPPGFRRLMTVIQ